MDKKQHLFTIVAYINRHNYYGILYGVSSHFSKLNNYIAMGLTLLKCPQLIVVLVQGWCIRRKGKLWYLGQ